MPILKNARHEAFAQAIAKGQTSDQAYQTAGFSANRGNATRLKAKESVSQRVDELLSKAAERTLVTIDSVTSELEEARALALATKQSAAAVTASMGKAKLHKLLIERAEVEHKGLEGLLEKISGNAIRPTEHDNG